MDQDYTILGTVVPAFGGKEPLKVRKENGVDEDWERTTNVIEENPMAWRNRWQALTLNNHLKSRCLKAHGALVEAGSWLLKGHGRRSDGFFFAEGFVDAVAQVPKNSSVMLDVLKLEVKRFHDDLEQCSVSRKDEVLEQLAEDFNDERVSRFYGGLAACWAFELQREQVALLQKEKAELAQQLAAAQDQISPLQLEFNNVCLERARLVNEVEEHQRLSADYQADAEMARQECESAKQSLMDLEIEMGEELGRLSNELATMQLTHVPKKVLGATDAQVVELQVEVQNLTAEIQELKQNNSRLTEALDKQQKASLRRLAGRVLQRNSMEGACAGIGRRLFIQWKVRTLKNQICHLAGEKVKLKGMLGESVADLTSQLHLLQRRFRELGLSWAEEQTAERQAWAEERGELTAQVSRMWGLYVEQLFLAERNQERAERFSLAVEQHLVLEQRLVTKIEALHMDKADLEERVIRLELEKQELQEQLAVVAEELAARSAELHRTSCVLQRTKAVSQAEAQRDAAALEGLEAALRESRAFAVHLEETIPLFICRKCKEGVVFVKEMSKPHKEVLQYLLGNLSNPVPQKEPCAEVRFPRWSSRDFRFISPRQERCPTSAVSPTSCAAQQPSRKSHCFEAPVHRCAKDNMEPKLSRQCSNRSCSSLPRVPGVQRKTSSRCKLKSEVPQDTYLQEVLTIATELRSSAKDWWRVDHGGRQSSDERERPRVGCHTGLTAIADGEDAVKVRKKERMDRPQSAHR